MQKIADFQNLSQAENRLIQAVRAGRPCVLHDDPETRPDPENPAHRIRADLLAVLITGGTKDCGLSPFGVQLAGAQITGKLRLTHLSAVGDTLLNYCRFDTAPDLRQARFNNLQLDGCELPGLFAPLMNLGADLFLRGTIAKGRVDMGGAKIGGQMACTGAKFDGGAGDALNAQGVVVGDSLILRGVTAKGSVVVNGAKIGGQMHCTEAEFDGGTGDALIAQGVVVGDSLILRGVTAKGSVDVNGAKIGGQMDCRGAKFDGGTGDALFAQGVEVGADLFLRGVTAKGRVVVGGAKIGGQMDCMGAKFDGGTGNALNAQGVKVGAALIWRGTKVAAGRVSLTAAHVRDLRDDVGNWPEKLYLDGFTYDRFIASSTLANDRLPWLKKGSILEGTFSPQPYTQAAKVLRAMGHDAQARLILVQREIILATEARRQWNTKPNGRAYLLMENPYKTAGLGVMWFWDLLQRHVVGYGFQPFLALRALVVLLGIAWLLAHQTWAEGSFAPNSDVIITSPAWQAAMVGDCVPAATAPKDCTQNPAEVWSSTDGPGLDWDTFHPIAYAVDLVVPLVTLGQTDAWAPSKDRGLWGWALWWGRWLLIGAGWLVSALGAAALTGIMQREKD